MSLTTSAGSSFAVIDTPSAHTTVPIAVLPQILGGRATVSLGSALAISSTTIAVNSGKYLTLTDDSVSGGYTQVLALDSPSTSLGAPAAVPTLHVIAQSGNIRAYLTARPDALAAIAQYITQQNPGSTVDLSTPDAIIDAYISTGVRSGIASSPAELDSLVAAAHAEDLLAAAAATYGPAAGSPQGPQRNNSPAGPASGATKAYASVSVSLDGLEPVTTRAPASAPAIFSGTDQGISPTGIASSGGTQCIAQAMSPMVIFMLATVVAMAVSLRH